MANDFKPTVGSKVSKTEAEKWITKYDDEHRKDKKKDTKSVFYGKDVLEEILKTPEATGISIFLSVKYNPNVEKDTVNFVLIPTKEDGTLIWAEAGGKDASTPVYDDGMICPPNCPK